MQATRPHVRNAAETKDRILDAAQSMFSEHGYSQTGVRDIAAAAAVAPSLITKYFGSKADLFRAALIEAFGQDPGHIDNRETYGSLMVNTVLDVSRRIDGPAMIALSLGDNEARAVVGSVLREHVIEPLGDTLGGGETSARAAALLLVGSSFAIFTRRLDLKLSGKEASQLNEIMVDIISGLVGVKPGR